jgi:hypothetical protein
MKSVVRYHVHKTLVTGNILIQTNLAHTHFIKINFNIILLRKPRFSFTFSDQNNVTK